MTALIEIDNGRLRVGMIGEFESEYQRLVEDWHDRGECKIFDSLEEAREWVTEPFDPDRWDDVSSE